VYVCIVTTSHNSAPARCNPTQETSSKAYTAQHHRAPVKQVNLTAQQGAGSHKSQGRHIGVKSSQCNSVPTNAVLPDSSCCKCRDHAHVARGWLLPDVYTSCAMRGYPGSIVSAPKQPASVLHLRPDSRTEDTGICRDSPACVSKGDKCMGQTRGDLSHKAQHHFPPVLLHLHPA
jgi:hypothetical protein